jgi:8-oxo-dGTP pyrophosphatase MutT (NUDIX family)
VIDDSWYVRPASIAQRTSAGGVVVRAQDGEALVALTWEKGYRGPVLPKGGVEPGEELLQAARREVEEEAGLNRLQLIAPLGFIERLTYDKRQWVTTHFFLFITDQITGTPTDPLHHEHEPLWRRLDQLDDMFWPDQRRLVLMHEEPIRRSLGLTPELASRRPSA